MPVIKTGTSLTVKPTLNLDFARDKQLDPRITFTRASNATYYDGYTSVKAEENLISGSNDFINYWSQGGVTASQNATAPDGTTTAFTFTETATTEDHQLASQNIQLTSGKTYIFSAFLKKGSGSNAPDFIQFAHGGITSNASEFNLSTGTPGSSGYSNRTMQDVGNGWYRCSHTYSASSTGTISFRIVFCNNTQGGGRNQVYLGDTNSDVLLWGAQVEERDNATTPLTYTATTSLPITKYQPALQTASSNVARFDHNPTTGESLGLLIEESRTNLITNSTTMAYGNSPYATVGAIVPDGTYSSTACPIPENVSDRYQHDIPAGTYANGTVLTFSWYAKALEGWGGNLSTNDGGFAFLQPVGLSTSNIVKIADSGNGWERWSCQVTITDNSITQILRPYFGYKIPLFTIRYAYWGFQLEQGTFATSYIKTTGSQVTRSEDSAVMTGDNFSSWYRQGQGTVYTDYRTGEKTSAFRIAALSSGSNNNRMEFAIASGTGNGPYAFFVANGINQVTSSGGYIYTSNTNYKSATGFKLNDTSFSNNGESTINDTSCIIPIVDRFYIGADASGAAKPNSTIRQVSFYPKRLTNNELQILTSGDVDELNNAKSLSLQILDSSGNVVKSIYS